MSRTGRSFLVFVFFLGAIVAVAQPADEKSEPKTPLVIKIDDGPLPQYARARLGKLGGFRYSGRFSTATMSIDGKRLAVADASGNTIDVIDIPTGKRIHHLQAQIIGGIQNGMAISPDGKTLATQSFQNLQVWDLEAGKQLIVLPNRDIANRGQGPSLSADGKIIGVGSERFAAKNQTGEVNAFEVATGKKFGPFETLHNYNIRGAVAPDGKTMASWGQYLRGGAGAADREIPRTLQVWDLAAGKELRKIKLDFGAQGFGNVSNAVYSPDGKTLAVVSGQSTFHFVEADTGKETRRFSGQRGAGNLSGIRFSPDGELFVAFDAVGTLQAWDVKTGKRLELDDGPKSQLLAVAFPGKNRIVALGNVAQSLHWWDANLGGKTSPFQGHLTSIAALAFSADGKSIVSAGSDQMVLWWDADTGKELQRLRLPDEDARFGGGGRNSFALAPNGKYAATQSSYANNGVRLWNLKTGRAVFDFEAPRSSFQVAIAFAPDTSKLAVSGAQNPLHVWDISTGQELPKMPANPGARNFGPNNASVAFSPDGKIVALRAVNFNQMGRQVAELILWDSVQGKELHRSDRQLLIGNNATGGMAFSSDGRYLALSETAGSILLLNATTGKTARTFASTNRNSAFQVAFSPDGRFLAVGCAPRNVGLQNNRADEPVVEIWELANGKVRETFKGHTGAISCLAFSPDAATLATGSLDTTVLLWDFANRSDVKYPPLTEKDLPDAWKALATNDAKAGVTIRRLFQTPAPTLAFMKENFKPTKNDSLDEKAIVKLVADLDSTNFKVREVANKELARLGERAEAALRKSLAGNRSLEARRRLLELLEGMVRQDSTPEELQAMRGVEVLERIGTAEARELLTALSKGDPVSRGTQEAAAALRRLK